MVEPLSFKAQDIDQMVQAFSANFEQVLLSSDLNRDGWISRAELMSVLLRANTPWQTADAIVTQIFQRVDTNRDGRIAIEDVRPQIGSGTGGAVTTVLPHTTIPLGCIHSRSRPSYGKLFGHLGATNYLEWHLWEISKSMEGSEATQRDGVIPAGYTYLGQFIDHDLTSEASTFRQTPSDTSQLRNLRTPRFDLDSLYDSGPEQSPALYSDGMRLMFGNQDNPRGDLARDPQGKALIGDPRNDEKEAELLENGERLGPVGGRIVAETFIGILKADPDSISHPQNWHEATTLPPNQFKMAELIDVANPPVGP